MVASEFSFSRSGSVENIAFILAELWALHRSFKPPTSSFLADTAVPTVTDGHDGSTAGRWEL